jgi:ribonuclease HII
MKKVLLHICCGVCAYAAIERLNAEGLRVEGFFYNPNIDTPEEYQKRLDVAKQVNRITSSVLHEAAYEPDVWLTACQAYKDEPEGGKRCLLCYTMRLQKAYDVMKQYACDFLSTTLTISPHKKSTTIISIGRQIAGTHFLPEDFKKKDGFKQSIEAAKKFNFYRQNYCGCAYSKTAADIRRSKNT